MNKFNIGDLIYGCTITYINKKEKGIIINTYYEHDEYEVYWLDGWGISIEEGKWIKKVKDNGK